MQTNKEKTNRVKEGSLRSPRPEYSWLFPVGGYLVLHGALPYKVVGMTVQEETKVLR